MNVDIENKIVRYLSGEATNKEKEEILLWKNSSPENKKIFKEIEIAFNTSEIVINPENYSSEKAYGKLEKKMKGNNSFPLNKVNFRRFLGYAATAIIAIGLTWFTQKYVETEPTVIQKVAEESFFQSVETPAGARSLVTLEDGTKIWLNANSKLTYPTHFDGNQRIVHLEGEGYFDVAKDKTWPFKVETSDLSINVLGTIFNVKSYPTEGLIETTLIEGEIILNKITNDNNEQEILKLKPKQKATFIKKDGILLKDEIYAAKIPENEKIQRRSEKLVLSENIDAEPIISWKDNEMIFKNETFESIAVSLERRYGVKIKFENDGVKEYRFSGVFDEISIDQALQALQFASPFHFKIDQKFIIIKK
jgi:ferric-dicitrate binding protein FerR (iron transport regulator)